jgi:hypothetical protein
MRKVAEVSVEEDGTFYYLLPGWKRCATVFDSDAIHHVYEPADDLEPVPDESARQQMKLVVRCACGECDRMKREQEEN